MPMQGLRSRSILLASALALGVGGVLAVTPLAGTSIAGAVPSQTVYVSPASVPSCGGTAPSYTSITAAVDAVPAGSTVIVCGGNYNEDVVVTKALTIIGRGAIDNVKNAPITSPVYDLVGSNAFTVLASGVTIEGFTVENATGDGILVGLANDATISDNTAIDNGGTGIDLLSSSWSTVSDNTATGNAGGGVYLTDDPEPPNATVPTSNDLVIDNVLNGNLGGCGVILADHSGAGIFDNKVLYNQINNNGDSPPGTGAGVVLASPVPNGAVYDNLIQGNDISGNGLAGVTLHSHIPGQGSFSGNVITRNVIGTNNVGGTASEASGDDGDPYTTGIYLGSFDSLIISIFGNTIENDQDGIYSSGGPIVEGAPDNWYFLVLNPFVSTPTYGG
jgi:parallel beta-helix repeat protein